MTDILRKICNNLNIKLIYTNNKFSILSCSIKDNQIVIRANNIFSNCTTDIADAVINYYIKTEHREENFKIIKDYADGKLNFKNYRIIHPAEKFYDIVSNLLMAEEYHNIQKSNLVELNISSITKKGYGEKTQKVNEENPIKVDEDDIMEVNIIVTPFNT